MELEMIKVFEKHATDKLRTAEQAVAQLVELSKTIGTNPLGGDNDPNSLASHQQAYLEKAKKILEEGHQKSRWRRIVPQLPNQFLVLDTLGHDIHSQAFLFCFPRNQRKNLQRNTPANCLQTPR